MVRSSLNASNIVVSPTKAILEKARKTHGIASETKVIYNGRELTISKERNKEAFILSVGRIWDEAKNLLLLSKIAKNLPWPVYIVGDNINPNMREEIFIENFIS